MTKALFFDIDGTLVSFNTHAIPLSAVHAINAAKEKGIRVFISTGRPWAIINNLGSLTFDGFITMNGASCVVGDEVIYKNSIPREDVQTLVRTVQQNALTCIFVTENEMYIVNPCRVSDEFCRVLNVPTLPSIDPEMVLEKEIFQVSPFITPEQEMKLMPRIPHCESGRWHPTFTDIVAKGNGKGHGVGKVANYFGFTQEETMAFGDGGNDLCMLRYAGIGIAMGNAAEDVKKAADYVTDTVDNDGVEKALRYFGVV